MHPNETQLAFLSVLCSCCSEHFDRRMCAGLGSRFQIVGCSFRILVSPVSQHCPICGRHSRSEGESPSGLVKNNQRSTQENTNCAADLVPLSYCDPIYYVRGIFLLHTMYVKIFSRRTSSTSLLGSIAVTQKKIL